MLNINTGVRMRCARISLSTSKPPRPGIETSRMMRCHGWLRATSSACWEFSASPNSASLKASASMSLRPLRNIA